MATGFDKRATTLSERQVVMHESGGKGKTGGSDAAGSSSDGRRRAAEAAAGGPSLQPPTCQRTGMLRSGWKVTSPTWMEDGEKPCDAVQMWLKQCSLGSQSPPKVKEGV